jgi:hypothetical protein
VTQQKQAAVGAQETKPVAQTTPVPTDLDPEDIKDP